MNNTMQSFKLIWAPHRHVANILPYADYVKVTEDEQGTHINPEPSKYK